MLPAYFLSSEEDSCLRFCYNTDARSSDEWRVRGPEAVWFTDVLERAHSLPHRHLLTLICWSRRSRRHKRRTCLSLLWSFPAHLQGVRLWVSAEHRGDSGETLHRQGWIHWKNHNCEVEGKVLNHSKKRKQKLIQVTSNSEQWWKEIFGIGRTRGQTGVMIGLKDTRPWPVLWIF